MITLTYLSTATKDFSTEELSELLEVSRRNNTAAGLTGMLLYAGGHFIQTLEGPDGVVDDAFRRIGQDPRHRDVLVALREQAETRTFADWSMGFETLSADEAAELPGFNDYLAHKTVPERAGQELGRAGIFHRVFRDRMR